MYNIVHENGKGMGDSSGMRSGGSVNWTGTAAAGGHHNSRTGPGRLAGRTRGSGRGNYRGNNSGRYAGGADRRGRHQCAERGGWNGRFSRVDGQ